MQGLEVDDIVEQYNSFSDATNIRTGGIKLRKEKDRFYEYLEYIIADNEISGITKKDIEEDNVDPDTLNEAYAKAFDIAKQNKEEEKIKKVDLILEHRICCVCEKALNKKEMKSYNEVTFEVYCNKCNPYNRRHHE